MQRGDPLRFEQSVFTKCKGGTLYVLNKARIQRNAKGGTLYVLNTVRLKFNEMQRGDPLRFEQSPYLAKFSEMQRGDPLRFEQSPDKIQRNAKGGPFTF